MSHIIERGPCDRCGSSDARMTYSDGHSWCFKCETYQDGGQGGSDPHSIGGRQGVNGKPLILDGEPLALKSRGINLATARFWGYEVSRDERGQWVQIANYKNSAGQRVGQHLRYADKAAGFPWRGERPKDVLYGQWLWGSGGKKVVVCEGEVDALSVSQVQDLKWPTVSLSAGAQSAAKDVSHPAIMRWLDSFDEVILYFDDDEPGIEAGIAVASLFPPGKVKIASVPGYKDANEALQDGKPEAVRSAIWNAKTYQPVELATLKDVFSGPYKPPEKGVSYPWPELTKATEGLRKHELTVIGAGIGSGKTTMVTEIMAHCLDEHNWSIGAFALEQTNDEFGCRLGSVFANRKLWPEPTEDMYTTAQGAVAPYWGRITLFQREHAVTWERMRYIIRYMAAMGRDLIVVDNLTSVVAGADSRNQVQLIDEIFKELGAIVAAFPVHIIVVSHLKRPEAGQLTHERGREVDMADFRGAGSIGIFAHYCWGLERDQYDDGEPARLALLKDRPNGRVARTPKTVLHFNENEQRLYTARSRGRMLSSPQDGTPEALAADVKDSNPDWGIPASATSGEISGEPDNGPVYAEPDPREVDDMKKPELDIPTNGERYVFDSETNGVDFSAPNPAAQVHTVHCVVAVNVKTGNAFRLNSNDPERMERGLRHLMNASELIGHNILEFDNPAIANVYPWFKPRGKLTDTKVFAQVMFPDVEPVDKDRWPWILKMGLMGKHSLEAWGQRLGEPKDEYTKWCEENGIDDPWGKWSERMEDYCEQDTRSNLVLYRFLVKEATQPPHNVETVRKVLDLEQEIALIIRRQRIHGFAFDTEAAKALYLELEKAKDEIAIQLRAKYGEQILVPNGGKTKTFKKTMTRKLKKYPWAKELCIAGAEYCPVKWVDFNPGSSDHIASLLINRFGWVPGEGALTDSSKEIYKQLGMTPEEIPQAVKEKRLKVSGAKEVLKALPYPFVDDVLKYQKQQKVASMVGGGEDSWLSHERDGRIHGKVNSLGAASVRMTHYQPNVAQTPAVDVDDDDHPVKGIEGGFGYECRSVYKAGEGKVLVGCDASGLELRMLGHYMAEYDGGEYAKAVVEGNQEDGTDVHSLAKKAIQFHQRGDTKTAEYAFLYGGGDEKLGAITFKQLTEDEAREFGQPTPESLKSLGAGIREKLINGFPGLDQLVEALAEAFDRGWLRGLDGRVLRPRKAHSILNLLLQSAGAIVMKHALVLCDRRLQSLGLVPGRDYEFVANIHDEWQIETTPEHAPTVAAVAAMAISKVERRLRMRVPLAGESKTGPTWAATH